MCLKSNYDNRYLSFTATAAANVAKLTLMTTEEKEKRVLEREMIDK